MLKSAFRTAADVGRTASLLRKSLRRARSVVKANPGLAATVVPDAVRRAAESLWPERLARLDALTWLVPYIGISGIVDARYVPGYAFARAIRPACNNEALALAYTDKARSQVLFPGVAMPRVVLRGMHGRYYDAEFRPVARPAELLAAYGGDELVVKPSLESGGGRGVVVGRIDAGAFHDGATSIGIEALLRAYGRNFVVQETLTQHALLAAVHPASVNTLRIITMRLEGGVLVLSSIVRFGVAAKRVDNEGTGGVSCGVDDDGALKPFAVDKLGRVHERHPSTGVPFVGRRVPAAHAARDLACALHDTLQHFDLLSWDIAIDEAERPTLIEVNIRGQGLEFHQLNNGPLFGERTEEVLASVRARGPARSH